VTLTFLQVAFGILISVVVALFARVVGLDRDREFYTTVLIVVASYNVLFAFTSGSMNAHVVESIVMAAFVAAAVTGFKTSRWIIIAGLAAHGVMDSFHGYVIDNPGVPSWWPAWCMAYDIGAASVLALLSVRRHDSVRPAGAQS
jgi:hypothetical protein